MTELCKWWAIAAALAAVPTRIFGQVLGGRRRLGGQKMIAGFVERMQAVAVGRIAQLHPERRRAANAI